MDNIRYLAMRERRRRKIGSEARCVICGESRQFAVSRFRKTWRCYEHLEAGHETEQHHVAGLERGPILALAGNDHRVLTAKTFGMLPERFRLPTRSPWEEMVATAVGHVLVDDALQRRPESPYRSVDVPAGARTFVTRLSAFPQFVHVFGSDESYYRPSWDQPFVRLG